MSRRFEKLIRDGIPDLAAREGRTLPVRADAAAEWPMLLARKLVEESAETRPTRPTKCSIRAAKPGGLAQLGEHLLCKQGVVGSIPSSSTTQTETNTKAASSEVVLLLAWISRSIGCSLKIHRVESALLMETVLSETRGGPCHQRHEFLIASKRIFRLRFEIRASKRKLHAAQRVR